MSLIDILTIILIIFAIILCIALVVFIIRIYKTIKAMHKDTQDFYARLNPLISEYKELADNLNNISDMAENQMKIVKSVIADVRDRVDHLLQLESKITGGIEDSVMPLVKNLKAIGKGLDTFWSRYKYRS